MNNRQDIAQVVIFCCSLFGGGAGEEEGGGVHMRMTKVVSNEHLWRAKQVFKGWKIMRPMLSGSFILHS